MKSTVWKVPPGILVLILFFSTGLFLISFALLNLETMKNLVLEDEAIENMQAVLYLVGAGLWIFAVYLTLKAHGVEKRRRIFYIIFFLLFLFFFLEEISWGQRLFGTSTPEELEEVNLQDETNVHNIGIGNSLLWIHILMALFLFLVGIIFPVLRVGVKRFATIFERLKFPVVDQNLIACFATALVFYSSPGFHWFVPLFILAIFFPVVIILSGTFKDFFNNFDYPLLQFTLVAVMGLFIIGLNTNLETAKHLSYNIAFEIRELLIAMALFFFALFEVHGAWERNKKNDK